MSILDVCNENLTNVQWAFNMWSELAWADSDQALSQWSQQLMLLCHLIGAACNHVLCMAVHSVQSVLPTAVPSDVNPQGGELRPAPSQIQWGAHAARLPELFKLVLRIATQVPFAARTQLCICGVMPRDQHRRLATPACRAAMRAGVGQSTSEGSHQPRTRRYDL